MSVDGKCAVLAEGVKDDVVEEEEKVGSGPDFVSFLAIAAAGRDVVDSRASIGRVVVML